MKFNYANSPLTAALIRKYEYERDQAIANLNVYFTNPAGIGEHGDIVSQMDEQINKLAVAEGNLKTFISTLGFIGEKNNISFNSIKPKSLINFVETSNSEIQNELNINPDQLLVKGVKKYIIDINLTANYKNLLSFFRELELQENIILFKDINLKLLELNKEKNSKDKSNNLNATLQIIVYGKI